MSEQLQFKSPGKVWKRSRLSEGIGRKVFPYYGELLKYSELTAREKSLIALAVAHAVRHI